MLHDNLLRSRLQCHLGGCQGSGRTGHHRRRLGDGNFAVILFFRGGGQGLLGYGLAGGKGLLLNGRCRGSGQCRRRRDGLWCRCVNDRFRGGRSGEGGQGLQGTGPLLLLLLSGCHRGNLRQRGFRLARCGLALVLLGGVLSGSGEGGQELTESGSR